MELLLCFLFAVVVVGAVRTLGNILEWIGEHIFGFEGDE
jgi:hypothetical protein